MPDYTSPYPLILPDYFEFFRTVEKLAIPHFILHALPLQSVADYSLSQHGNDFPRPSQHFVIADYLIDLPIIAVDLGATSSDYGRVISYAYGDYWIVGDSLLDFAKRLTTKGVNAVWGKE